MEFKYNDGLGPRSRCNHLLLIGPGDQVQKFAGETIPGICAVVGADYDKSGKWSTTYRLALAAGVRAMEVRDGWETGTLREALKANRWVDAANTIGVSLPVCQAFICSWKPKAAAHWDKVEEDLAAVDDLQPDGGCLQTISFGSPTRRMRDDGFWSWPVLVLAKDGNQIGKLTPTSEGWVVDGPIKLLDEKTAGGHGGGYVSLQVAVPDGCTLIHGAEQCSQFKIEKSDESQND